MIRDQESGAILAQGYTSGGTGSLSLVMKEPRTRGRNLLDGSTAKFGTVLDVVEPTLVTIEAWAPYSHWQSLAKVSTQRWLIPGRDIVGDGVILEIPGFAVDVMHPQSSERIRLADTRSVSIKANVVMMCGCPIMPGGMWDANRYEVKGLIKHNGLNMATIPLSYAGKVSTFQGRLDLRGSGVYEIQVFAYDSQTGNTGVDKVVVKVSE